MQVTLLLILSCNNSFGLNIASCCESNSLSSFPLLGLWTFLHEEHFLPNACFVSSARVWRRLLPTFPGPAKEDSSMLKMQWCEPERCPLLCLVWGQGTCSCCLWGQTCCCFSAAMSHFSLQNSCQSVNTVIIKILAYSIEDCVWKNERLRRHPNPTSVSDPRV